ncbi:MAG: MotA/TolQ/ExbB proton channel family protein [Nitrospirota bacterium]
MDPSDRFSVFDFVASSGPIALSVLAILILCSVATCLIIACKVISLRRIRSANHRFIATFQKARTLEDLKNDTTSLRANYTESMCANDPIGKLFDALIAGVDFDSKKILADDGTSVADGVSIARMERVLKSSIQHQMDLHESNLHLLATIGNTAPFVGLFGTVVGIVSSFRAIGLQEAANIAVVAPGISEALIATAAGLAAAIPAAVFYNIFTHTLRRLEVELEIFSSELINFIETSGCRERRSDMRRLNDNL